MGQTINPLVLTLQMDTAAFERFDELRQRYFPPDRNLVPAHISLFHALPGAELATVVQQMERVAKESDPLPVDITGVRSLGRGVAYVAHSPALIQVRRELAAAYSDWLTPQDRGAFQPHITVQNKVSVEEARLCLLELRASFVQWSIRGIGFQLWEYQGGPWHLEEERKFTGGKIAGDPTKPASFL